MVTLATDGPWLGPGLWWGLAVLALLGDGLYRILGRARVLPVAGVNRRAFMPGAARADDGRPWPDRVGLRILLAEASIPWICLLLDLAHLSIGRASLTLSGLLLFAAGMLAEGRFPLGVSGLRSQAKGLSGEDAWRSAEGEGRPGPAAASAPAPGLLRSPAAAVLAAASGLIVLCGAAQALFLPVHTYDALVGFDLVGKVMALEGRLFSSVYTQIRFNAQAVYAPFAATNTGFWYIFHPALPQLWPPLLAVGFLLPAWRWVRDRTESPTAASLAVFLILLPKQFAFSLTVGQTDLPAAVFCSLAIFAAVDLLQGREGVAAPALYLLAATTVRSENALFGLVLGLFFFLRPVAGRPRRRALWLALPPLAFFIIWNLVLVKGRIGFDPARYFRMPGVDLRRIFEVFWRAGAIILSPSLFAEYGYLILSLPILWALGRWERTAGLFARPRPGGRDPDTTGGLALDTTGGLLLISVLLLCFYMGFFYLWNEDLQPLWTMQNTFKRGFLRFIPGFAAAFAAAPPVLWLLRRCDR